MFGKESAGVYLLLYLFHGKISNMNKTIVTLSFLLIAFAFSAGDAEAYRSLGNVTTKINDTTYLLAHAYTLGFLNADMNTPILAGLEETSQFDTAQNVFSVEGEGELTVSSIVLSGQDITSGGYEIAAGDRPAFMLIAIVEGVLAGQGAPVMTLEKIPFTYIKNGESTTEEGAYTFFDQGAAESDILVAP